MRMTAILVLALACAAAAQERPADVGTASRPAAGRFYAAIRADDLSALRSLIEEYGVDAADSDGATPLMWASAVGSTDAVKLLLKAGANAKAANTSGATALHWSRGEPVRVRLLLEHGADVDARTAELNRTPLGVLASAAGTGDVCVC
jgi:hypothetical protein